MCFNSNPSKLLIKPCWLKPFILPVLLSKKTASHVKPFTVKKDCNECWQRYLWLTALFCHWSSMWKAKPRNGDHSSFCLTNLAKMATTLMWNVWPLFGNWNLCYFTCYLSYFTSKKMNLFLTLSLSVTFSLMRGPNLSVARPCCAWGPGEDLRCLSQMFSDVSSLFHHCFTMATDLDMWSWLHLGCYSCYPCYHWAVLICICESKRAVSTRMCAKMSWNFCWKIVT